jgi:CspA family cold shock protein
MMHVDGTVYTCFSDLPRTIVSTKLLSEPLWAPLISSRVAWARNGHKSPLTSDFRASDMHTSTVKWFDAEKGYGFIHHPNQGEDVFVHYSNIQSEDDFKTLKSDQRVRFEMNEGPKGLHALEVDPFSSDAEQGEENARKEEAEGESFDLSDIDPTAEVDPSLSGGSSLDSSL